MLKKTLILISVLAVAVSVAYTQETLKPVDSLIVVDSTGKRVGDVVSWNNKVPGVAFQLNNFLFLLYVAQHRFFGTGYVQLGDTLYFESTDCSGTPFLLAEPLLNPSAKEANLTPVPVVAVNLPGNTLYIPDENAPVNRTMKSVLDPFTPQGSYTAPGTCSSVNSLQISSLRAKPSIDLDTLFTPPFKL